jgi:hypothetical protein
MDICGRNSALEKVLDSRGLIAGYRRFGAFLFLSPCFAGIGIYTSLAMGVF